MDSVSEKVPVDDQLPQRKKRRSKGDSEATKELVSRFTVDSKVDGMKDESFDTTLTIGKPYSSSTQIHGLPMMKPVNKILKSSPLKNNAISHDEEDLEMTQDLIRISNEITHNNASPLSLGDFDMDQEILQDLNLRSYVEKFDFNPNDNFMQYYIKVNDKINQYESDLIKQLMTERFKLLKRFESLNGIVNQYSQSLIKCDKDFDSKINQLKLVNNILNSL
ncbi:hypothetical protein QCA50_017123 [Cerrena zonata]|uniref:Uncharacterized protein n=1 Tax=Cerrena zonata TaxID=2478898 RepID=A0AAW0FFR9_9APHY